MMRSRLVVVAIVTVLGGATACTGDTATSSDARSAPAVPDETATVCAQAISEGNDAVADFKAAMSAGVAAVMAGDTAKATALEAELHSRVGQWADTLSELSRKRVTAEVRTFLTGTAATLNTLNRADDRTSVQQVEARFADIGTRLAVLCSRRA